VRVLFADYDGVFHPVSDLKWFAMGMPTDLAIERGGLFRWTRELADILELHPDVKIVVHSSWRLLHPESKVKSLLGPLSDRFIGIIPPEHDRHEGICAYVAQHGLTDYRILDDHPECFPDGLQGLIVCDSENGVLDQNVRAQICAWLENRQLV
jgi:hypothetical protein